MFRAPRLWLASRLSAGAWIGKAHPPTDLGRVLLRVRLRTLSNSLARASSIAVTSRDTSGRLTSSRGEVGRSHPGGSPERQRGLPLVDVRIDKVQRSLC